jgi:glycosyltransferase involved in cell wall biosynthesis
MRVAIATAQVPFVTGGAEFLAQSLEAALVGRGIATAIVSIPFKWYPPPVLLDMMLSGRLLDLSEVNGLPIDRVITLKFPAYYLDHPCKVGWLLHQHRQAYDLFETPFGDLHQDAEGRAVAAEIRRWDDHFLPRHRALFTISRTVSDRLRRYNAIEAPPLYHPPPGADRFHCAGYEAFVLAPGRLDGMKRQKLMIEAMAELPETVGLVLIGATDGDYGRAAREMAAGFAPGRVTLLGVVPEAEKLDLYARCLAVYNGVYDEDYGYVTLEAFLASKPVITHPDSGGPLEFVRHEDNGFVVDPDPSAIAACIRPLADNPAVARAIGGSGRATIDALGVGWDSVLEKLLA